MCLLPCSFNDFIDSCDSIHLYNLRVFKHRNYDPFILLMKDIRIKDYIKYLRVMSTNTQISRAPLAICLAKF